MSGGDLDLTTSDDAINGSSGSSSDTAQDDPGARPEGAPEDAADGGERPERGTPPDGATPPEGAPEGGFDEGSRPEGAPEGAPEGGGMGGGMGGGGMQAEDDVVVTISGGTLRINAEGDGLDSNGDLVVTGGTTTVYGPTSGGNGALDANGDITVSGGSLIALGSSGMAEAPGDDSKQGWLQADLGTVEKGAVITVTDADGTEVASLDAIKSAGNLVIASDDIESGVSYTVSVDGEKVATVTAGESSGGQAGFPGGR